MRKLFTALFILWVVNTAFADTGDNKLPYHNHGAYRPGNCCATKWLMKGKISYIEDTKRDIKKMERRNRKFLRPRY